MFLNNIMSLFHSQTVQSSQKVNVAQGLIYTKLVTQILDGSVIMPQYLSKFKSAESL